MSSPLPPSSPPMPPPPGPTALPPPGPTGPPPPMPPPPVTVGRKPLRAGHLPLGWRWALAAVWIVAMGAFGALAQEAFLVDSGPFWLSFSYLPFALPAAAVIALGRDSRRAVEWSLLAIAATAAIGAGDLVSHHRATGLVELAIAASVLVGVVGGALNRAADAPPADPIG